MDRYIPFHLIAEILSKLPVKSLLKFKCVSKSWLALVSSPQFIKAHLKHQTSLDNQSLIVLENDFYSLKYCSLNSLWYGQANPHVLIPQDERSGLGASAPTNDRNLCRCFEIVGCCDGLICLCFRRPSPSDFLLWNPSIRKYKMLPNLGLPSTDSLSWLWGFGYDASNDDYKVVAQVIHRSICGKYYSHQTIVYSTRTEAWRRIADLPNNSSYVSYQSPGVLAQWKLHFLFKDKACSRHILSLDLATETYTELEATNPKENDLHAMLGEIGGSLWYYKIHDLNRWVGELWTMKEYGKSWTKVITVPHKTPGPFFFPKVLAMSATGELLALESLRIGVYNSRDGQCFRPCKEFNGVYDARCFIESLVFP